MLGVNIALFILTLPVTNRAAAPSDQERHHQRAQCTSDCTHGSRYSSDS